MKQKLFKCEHCGNIIMMIKDAGVPVMCCGQKMTELVPEEASKCDLPPVDTNSINNYTVCKCNQVSYFDILDEVQKQGSLENLLDVFEAVKNTTHCSTGCGGCYEKVIEIISGAIM